MQSFLKKVLQDKRGELYIRACILIIIILIIFILLFNYTMITVQARAQRKGAIQTLDQYTQLNAIEIFDSIKSENDTTEELDPDLFVTLLCSSQGLVETDGVYCAYSSDNECLYKVSDIRMSFLVDNTSKIKVSYTLTVPLSFAGNTMWIDVPVTISTSINPKFESSGTLYTVKHWKESPNGEYILDTTWSLTGPANSYVTPPTKTYKGFTSPAPQTVVILEDRSTVVNYYYGRMRFNVTVKKDAGIESVSGSGRYFYGDTVVINATVSDGYTWGGWIDEQNVLPDASAITNTIEVTENITLIATTKDANNKSVHAVTYDFGINQGINAGTYFDTGYKIDWDKDFQIQTTVNIPTLGQQYLVFGSYDASSSTSLNVEITEANQLRVRLGSDGTHDKRYGVLAAGEKINIMFSWDASADSYTLTVDGVTMDFNASGSQSMSGVANKSLRVGARDHRSGTQSFGDIYVAGFQATGELVNGETYSLLPGISRTGYTFDGWYNEANEPISSTDIVALDRPVTLCAKGSAAVYKVTLDQQGATTAGTLAYYYQYGTYYLTTNGAQGWLYADAALTQPMPVITVPALTNSIFGGYYSEPFGGGTQYIDGNGNIVAYGRMNTAGSGTLYAYWIAKYSITWANWDGTVLQTQLIEPGIIPNYTGETPTRAPDKNYHYSFSGWSPAVSAAESNVIYTAQYAATAHDWGAVTYTWDSCDACSATATCTVCSYELTEEGVVEETNYRSASCTVSERWRHTATFVYFADDICDWHYGSDAKGHLWGGWYEYSAPCCEKAGSEHRDCQRYGCGYYETRTVAAIGHDWTEWVTTKEPTCTEAGEKSRNCSNGCTHGCCDEQTMAIEPLDHIMGELTTTTEPGCETTGTATSVCQRPSCGETVTTELAALGHVWPDDWTREVDPCCNITGVDAKRCERDSNHKQSRVVEATGCSWGDWSVIIQPTCTETGRQIRYCTNSCDPDECGCCDGSQWEDIPDLGHNYQWVVTTAVTCGADGLKSYQCSRCNHEGAEPETITDRPNHSNITIHNNPDPIYAQNKWIHYHHCGVCNSTFYCYGSCSYVSDDPRYW